MIIISRPSWTANERMGSSTLRLIRLRTRMPRAIRPRGLAVTTWTSTPTKRLWRRQATSWILRNRKPIIIKNRRKPAPKMHSSNARAETTQSQQLQARNSTPILKPVETERIALQEPTTTSKYTCKQRSSTADQSHPTPARILCSSARSLFLNQDLDQILSTIMNSQIQHGWRVSIQDQSMKVLSNGRTTEPSKGMAEMWKQQLTSSNQIQGLIWVLPWLHKNWTSGRRMLRSVYHPNQRRTLEECTSSLLYIDAGSKPMFQMHQSWEPSIQLQA